MAYIAVAVLVFLMAGQRVQGVGLGKCVGEGGSATPPSGAMEVLLPVWCDGGATPRVVRWNCVHTRLHYVENTCICISLNVYLYINTSLYATSIYRYVPLLYRYFS